MFFSGIVDGWGLGTPGLRLVEKKRVWSRERDLQRNWGRGVGIEKKWWAPVQFSLPFFLN